MKLTPEISGHTFLPSSGNQPGGLVVLLHGYGGTGMGLYQSLSRLRTEYPELAFAVPNGPFTLFDNAFAWIRLAFPIVEEELWNGAVAAAPLLNEYIDHELALLGLNDQQLMLIGFSQGSIMALHIGLRRKTAPLAIVALSGFLVGPQHLNEISAKPPVYLIGGDADEVVTPAVIYASRKALLDYGVEVKTTLIDGLGHKINQAMFNKVAEAMANFYNPANVSQES